MAPSPGPVTVIVTGAGVPSNVTSVASRIPVPPMILLSGAQMRTIFLVVEVLLPLTVFGLALLMWWRRR